MLLWAVFTSGFIVGGIFASYLLDMSRENEEVPVREYPKYTALTVKDDPEKLFEQLVQINYQKSSSKYAGEAISSGQFLVPLTAPKT